MAKNADFVSHKKSKQIVDGKPKLPLASDLVEGEIAINFAEGVETLSIKNESGDVITFSSDNYYSEKKLGSAFTGANSAVTVTDVIEENERVIAASLTDLDERKLDASAYTPSGDSLWEAGTGLNSVVLKGSSGTASGDYSVAEGYSYEYQGDTFISIASGSYSHTEGSGTKASGDYGSHAEGDSTSATSDSSHAEGLATLASGDYSHAEGLETIASGDSSHAEGEATLAEGYTSHAEGYGTKAIGDYSHTEGDDTVASGSMSHAEGDSTSATSNSSHAEGLTTLASGSYSHAEGLSTSATSDSSHAEGVDTLASGYHSHAEGDSTSATSYSSHAEGLETLASGDYSHTEGNNTITNNNSEHASGQFNVSSSATTTFGNSGNTLFSVGNGTADNARHNAFEIRQNGDIYIVDKNGTSIKLQDNLGGGSGIVDQVLDDTTSASTNAVSSKAVYKAVTDNELVWTNAYVTISGAISSHTEDASIHVTAADKEKLHTHSNKSALDSITGNVGTMAYEDVNSYSSATQVNNALGVKVNSATYTTYTASTATEIGNKAAQSDLNTLSGTVTGHTADTTIHFTTGTVQTQIDNSISGKVNTSDIISAITPSNSGSTAPIATKVVAENEQIVSVALTDLNGRKLDASAYTPTDLSNYYTKSETSGATEISNALQGKSNTNHDQAANTITAMTGYVTSSTVSDISTSDTLNQAMAKLEARFGGIRIVTISQTAYDNLPTPRDSSILYVITD